MLTYKKNPQGREYIEITSYGKPGIYDIVGIEKGSRNNQKERRDLLIQIIARNSGRILHTHVIQLVVELSGMAKATIENELRRLEEDDILYSEKIGDNLNAVRRWSIRHPESDIEKGAKQTVLNINRLIEKYVFQIEKKYSKFNSAQKAWAMTHLLLAIHSCQPTIEVTNQEYNIKKSKKLFDNLVAKAYDILKNENRDYIDGRPILRRLIELKTSEPITEIEDFLKRN